MQRKIGDWDISALGMGCWAIGGPAWWGDSPASYGTVDDKESIKALQAGIKAGINFIDTADVYGAGHSESIIGKAIKGNRDKLVIASKFGYTFDEATKQCIDANANDEHIEFAIEETLRRLQTDVLDIAWFHINDFPAEEAPRVADKLEQIVQKGKIKKFGWSTDFVDRAQSFVDYQNCVGFEFDFNVFKQSPMLEFVEKHQCAGVNRGPLAMGMLSGKYDKVSFEKGDMRNENIDWMTYFKDGKTTLEFTNKLNAIREILSSNGRSTTQGALAWIWGKSDLTIPIPGFKTVKQVESNAKAMEFGALTNEQILEIDEILNPVLV